MTLHASTPLEAVSDLAKSSKNASQYGIAESTKIFKPNHLTYSSLLACYYATKKGLSD
jgi:hypothetical protein